MILMIPLQATVELWAGPNVFLPSAQPEFSGCYVRVLAGNFPASYYKHWPENAASETFVLMTPPSQH